MFQFSICLFLFYLPSALSSPALSAPDDHAPIAVMADHGHKANKWMLSLRYSQMSMTNNFKGTKKISTEDILKEGFSMAPKTMSMAMGMFGFMYGFTDTFTFMITGAWTEKTMSMATKMSSNENRENHSSQTHQQSENENMENHSPHTHNQAQTENKERHSPQTHQNSQNKSSNPLHSHNISTEGFSDVKLGGIFTVYESKPTFRSAHKWIIYAGASLPTGPITESKNKLRYPYSMQLGSGTIDPILSSVYTFKKESWSLGSQIQGLFRLYNNQLNYRLGNEYKATAWLAYNLLKELSLSARLEYKNWTRIQGADSSLDKKMSPSHRPDFYSGESLNSSLGFNFYRTKGLLKNHRLALELGIPLYQKLKTFMGLNYYFMLGWQLSL